MAKLTAKARKALPASKFAGPNRSYPVQDRSHAANAKARASQAVHEGRMSKSSEAKIDAKANRVLGKSAAPRPTTMTDLVNSYQAERKAKMQDMKK